MNELRNSMSERTTVSNKSDQIFNFHSSKLHNIFFQILETMEHKGSGNSSDPPHLYIKLEQEGHSSSSFHQSDDEPCLICLSVNTGGGENKTVADVDGLWKHFRRPGEPASLGRSVCWIFVLRQLLHYPKEQVAGLLASTGVGPGEWCNLCGACSRLVLEAFQAHRECLKLEAKIALIGDQLKEELGRSIMDRRHRFQSSSKEESTEGILEVYKIIRQFYEEGGGPGGGGMIWSGTDTDDGSPPPDPPDNSQLQLTHNNQNRNGPSVFASGSTDPTNISDDVVDEDDNDSLSDDWGGGSGRGSNDDDDLNEADEAVPLRRRSTRQISISTRQTTTSSSSGSGIHKKKRLKTGRHSTPETKSSKDETSQKIIKSGFTQSKLKRHMKMMKSHSNGIDDNQKKNREFSCPICHLRMGSHHGRFRHIQKRHPGALLRCPDSNCVDFSTTSASTYYKHETRHKLKDCLEPLPNESDSQELLLRCKFCGSSGPEAKMIRHMKLKHLPQIGIDSFPCTQCDLVVLRACELKQHCARMHPTTTTTGGGGASEVVPRDKQWKCEHCSIQYYQKESLRKHVEKYHCSGRRGSGSVVTKKVPIPKVLECEICGERVLNDKGMGLHMKQKHQEHCPFKCDSCGIAFVSQRLLQGHVRIKHNNNNAVEEAEAESSGNHYFQTQLEEEKEEQASCRQEEDDQQETPPIAAPVAVVIKDEIIVDDETRETSAKTKPLPITTTVHHQPLIKKAKYAHQSQYKCEKCDYSTSVKARLGLHLQNHFITDHFIILQDSDSGKESQCKLCGNLLPNAFRYKHLNSKHAAVLDVHLYQCHVCGKGFNSAFSFTMHGAVHNKQEKKGARKGGRGLPPEEANNNSSVDKEKFICDQCGTSFTQRSTLVKHRKRFHSGNDDDGTTTTTTPHGDASRKCKWCGLTLLHNRLLAAHLRELHGEIFRFKCDECGAVYQRRKQLSRHKDSVHLKQTWTCQYCHRSYSSSAKVSTHLRLVCKAYKRSPIQVDNGRD